MVLMYSGGGDCVWKIANVFMLDLGCRKKTFLYIIEHLPQIPVKFNEKLLKKIFKQYVTPIMWTVLKGEYICVYKNIYNLVKKTQTTLRIKVINITLSF
jgi:hypothetical protein